MGALRDRYCLVGVRETEYSRNSGRSTLAMAVEAIRQAMDDAGRGPGGVDGMLSYEANDSTPSMIVGADLRIRLNFCMDVGAREWDSGPGRDHPPELPASVISLPGATP